MKLSIAAVTVSFVLVTAGAAFGFQHGHGASKPSTQGGATAHGAAKTQPSAAAKAPKPTKTTAQPAGSTSHGAGTTAKTHGGGAAKPPQAPTKPTTPTSTTTAKGHAPKGGDIADTKTAKVDAKAGKTDPKVAKSDGTKSDGKTLTATTPTGSSPTTTGGTTTLSPVQLKLQQNTNLAHKLESRLPKGTNLVAAAEGFRNLGQFVAAVNVSNNLKIPFADLKTKMVDDGLSLGQSIKALRPATSASVEVQRAEFDAHGMIAESEREAEAAKTVKKDKPAKSGAPSDRE